MVMSESETPLPGQQICPDGHICSGRDNFCSTCGAALDDGGDGDAA